MEAPLKVSGTFRTGTFRTHLPDRRQLTIDFFGSSDGATSVAIQPDGRILVAGLARNGSTTGLGLVRLVP